MIIYYQNNPPKKVKPYIIQDSAIDCTFVYFYYLFDLSPRNLHIL